jgi:prepilin-type N-terminal cleavage/methylation domain-containing protein
MNRKGFTLIELLVTITVLGILAAVAIPNYISTKEQSYARDAVTMLEVVSYANQAYSADHNVYAFGLITNACNTTACQAGSNPYNACNLVGCKYLPPQDWDSKPYVVALGGELGTFRGPTIASTRRRTSDFGWCYSIDDRHQLYPGNDAPEP